MGLVKYRILHGHQLCEISSTQILSEVKGPQLNVMTSIAFQISYMAPISVNQGLISLVETVTRIADPDANLNRYQR